jgi:predicted NAD-dependent protein-ADP-ribosyltransferase YbiA (DUF1768 family)
VEVNFISIGAPHKEYLVPFKLLEDKMRLIGCELLTVDELKEVGMVNSSATFDVSWEMAKKKGTTFKMNDAVKQFSFMNRWFIFKRKRQESMAAALAEAAITQNAKPNAKPNNKVPNAVPNAAPNAPAAEEPPVPNIAGKNVGRNAASAAKANAVAEAATAIQRNGEAPARTVGVAPGPAAAPVKSYALGEVFQFYADASTVKDQLGMKPPDKGAARWLAPGAPFPITDEEVAYPTMEHYMAGMRVKLATNKPELAMTLFSREGTIHQRFLNDRLAITNGGTKQLSEEEDHDLLKAELSAVKTASTGMALKKYKAVVDEAAWATAKDKALEDAIKQRWDKDARFRKIIETARGLGK